jgi:hypothetical protein
VIGSALLEQKDVKNVEEIVIPFYMSMLTIHPVITMECYIHDRPMSVLVSLVMSGFM